MCLAQPPCLGPCRLAQHSLALTAAAIKIARTEPKKGTVQPYAYVRFPKEIAGDPGTSQMPYSTWKVVYRRRTGQAVAA